MSEQGMQVHLLETIAFRPDVPGLLARLRIRAGSANEQAFRQLLEEACGLAHPRAVYFACAPQGQGDGWVEIGGRRFTSQVMRANLEGAQQVFPYLATCGVELQDWAGRQDDLLLNFWAEAIKESALACALGAMYEDIERRYRPGKMASMNPGSLADWPIQQQGPLFDLLGAWAGRVGVTLTESFLMVPTKSVSGVCFPSEAGFESCQLCPREDCPGRRALYQADLAAQLGVL